MAYYDNRQYSHNDRYPPADPYHYGSSGGYGGNYPQMDVVTQSSGATGARDAYYRNHPARDSGYGYGYDGDYHPYSKRSQEYGRRAHSNEDPDYYHSSSRRSRRHHNDRRGREKYAYSPSSSRSPPRRRRSLSERALSALGLGSAATATSKHRDSSTRGRSRTRDHRSYSYSPSPTRGSRHHRDKSEQRIAQAVKAALTAGAVEAFRVRKEPGDWTGEKGKRILTAALTAGGTDGIIDRDPSKHAKRHILESTLAGLAANRVVNGPRSRSRSRSRRRPRSHSHGGSKAKDAALMGILAVAGKEAYDHYRSRSRSKPRHRSRSRSRDSYDDYASRPRRSHKKRSKSVSDYINDGMAALGLGDKSDKDDRRSHRHRSSRYDSDDSDDSRYGDYDDYYRRRRHASPPRARHSRDVSRPPYYIPVSGARGDEGPGNSAARFSHNYSRPDSQPITTTTHNHTYDRAQSQNKKQTKTNSYANSNSSSSIRSTSTDDEDKKLKRLNRETLWATGLATAATIHAAHSLTENMGKHRERQKQLKEGQITPEEARRRRQRNRLSDLASVGVAAVGIQSAVAEWKHFDEKRRERARLRRERKERHRPESRSRAQRAHSASFGRTRPPRTVYPYEIEETRSNADPRSRSLGGSGLLA